MQGEGKKSVFHFPNPQKSVEGHKTCKAWLENLKNARLPRKWKFYTRCAKITSNFEVNQIASTARLAAA